MISRGATLDVRMDAINREHSLGIVEIESGFKAGLPHFIRCGEMLKELKEEVGHGHFLAAVKEYCEFSHDMANRYMLAATRQITHTGVISSIAALLADRREQKAIAPPKPKPPRMLSWLRALAHEIDEDKLPIRRTDNSRTRTPIKRAIEDRFGTIPKYLEEGGAEVKRLGVIVTELYPNGRPYVKDRLAAILSAQTEKPEPALGKRAQGAADRLAALRILAAEGLSLKEIAQRLKIATGTVRVLAKASGIEINGSLAQRSAERKENIRDLTEQGLIPEQIAERLGIGVESVVKNAKAASIKLHAAPARKIVSDRVIDTAVTLLEDSMASVRQLLCKNFELAATPEKRTEWVESLGASIKAIAKLRKQLLEYSK